MSNIEIQSKVNDLRGLRRMAEESRLKGLWSWHCAEDGNTWHRGTKTMSQIRSKYGSTRFTAAAERDPLPPR